MVASVVGATPAGPCAGRTGTGRRREFQVWCTAVGATPRSAFTDFSGMTRLRAIATRHDGLADTIVLVEVFPDDESEAHR
jgi:hypothetical protein